MDFLRELLVEWHHGNSCRRNACKTQEFMSGDPFGLRCRGISKPHVKVESGKQSVIQLRVDRESRTSKWSRSQVSRRCTQTKGKPIIQFSCKVILQEFPEHLLRILSLKDLARGIVHAKVNVLGRSCHLLKAKFDGISSFQQPARMFFHKESCKQTFKGHAATQTA